MEVLSQGWRTDLALLERSGSLVEHHADHVVVRTPDNPGYRWGNFLLLRHAPEPAEVDAWLSAFEAALPGLPHRTFGVDDPAADRTALAPLAARGLRVTEAVVLTAADVRRPPHPNGDAELRRLGSDADWEERVGLSVALAADSGDDGGGPAYEEFARTRAQAERRLVEQGGGAWFGAFLDGRMVAGLGIFRAGEGLARYQEVETHPEHRRRGLAGTLVHHAGRHALEELGVATLVIVADADYHALRIYEGVGFAASGRQLQAELADVRPAG